ncbi:MAG: ArsA family ATPase [Actinobacteria bacterium]|nr:MAG: ArsA family ATPase [Actinomycetota bacterium]
MTPAARSLESLLATREIVIFCGSGGVGKTTTAAAAALGAASELGAKALVLTIDPARRLADALGVEEFGNLERRVPDDLIRAAGLEPRGELYAAMLDTKRSWDELVLRHAPNEETAYRILENRLYQNIAARFVQSHDYIAIERLYDIHASGRYDLVVIDTPPSRNAIDFLDAPKRMADFFGGRLLRWLTMPYRVGGKRGARMINFASRPFYQLADRVLGSQFLQDIAEFFLNFQTMYDGFRTRARGAVERLLYDRRTSFVVVTTLEGAPLREGEFFSEQLTTRGFHLGAMVLNRVLPEALLSDEGARAAAVLAADSESLGKMLSDLDLPELSDAERNARVLRIASQSFRDFSVVAKREAELRNELSRLPDVVASVPAFTDDISDLDGLARIAAALFGRP